MPLPRETAIPGVVRNPGRTFRVITRIARRTLNILSAFSLLLCLAIIACWIRAQFKADWLQFHRTDPKANTWRAADLVTGRSGLYISWQLFLFDRPGHAEEYARDLKRINGFDHTVSERQAMPFRGTFWNRIGFAFNLAGMQSGWSGTPLDRSTFRYRFDNAHLPYWFLLLLFASGGLPLILRWRSRQRRARRLRLNQCLSCGYDLRGSAQRCPECGHPVVAEQGASTISPAPK